MTGSSARWVRTAVDYGAPIAFAIAFFGFGKNMLLATGVLVAASVLALIVGYVVERRIAPLPLIAGIFAIVFGGLTLIFHDEAFVKMKLSFQNAAFAAALLGGVALGKNPLKLLLGDSIRMADAAWRTLSVRYGLYFIAIAVANEIVWRTQSNEFWVGFRIAVLPLALVFSITQVPFMMKHMEKPEEKDAAPEPPDPGV
ncbi:inner membrane-spanning protein YciB [Caulobacter mirabilis]|uniref:Inner membrane-spanning protein YciB n=1 Tax=Caulobacter mirabilis TaxID=69666 RepID=A0A2D2B2J2_9CAUL|nr:inner membrane-spanning protein YciB [Caulobacter mirabilis]ATQ44479.1 intracellular septation protein A [Caulobacter mirabilis]